ncbi:LysM domain receptor-like kinase 3 [Linum perenne]
MYPFPCSKTIPTCKATLYHSFSGHTPEQLASFYSVPTSDVQPLPRNRREDYIITVPCSCLTVTSTTAYFYPVTYPVQQGDTFSDVSSEIYRGQVWVVGNEAQRFVAGDNVTLNLLCGCEGDGRGEIVTYTVENGDTLSDIGHRFHASLASMVSLNQQLGKDTAFIDVGWVLYVPQGSQGGCEDFEKGVIDSEGPVLYSIEEIQEATNDFDESKKIGEGGYGLVFFGVLRGQEVAIKVMRSNKSKEFYAEVNVLCKIHHINVVELLGYASDDDHFFLVYEYVRNGSLSDHLHEPLLKGYQPLSWTARTQIAVDAAKGIEYIHDHTKARYVHRDIKSSNILLNEYIRAKVADFGLAKLVERSSSEDHELIATRLVGTPGYLPPESVKELQVTSKTDVFGFGVVLAELITGKRALVRDHKEPSRLKSLITTVSTEPPLLSFAPNQ